MRTIWHHGWGHGLRPGEDHDINCLACKRETAQDQAPFINDGQHPDAPALRQWLLAPDREVDL